MKALSIQQPWLYAIFTLGKRVENRTWYTDYRGPLLLHASRTFDWHGRDQLIRDGHPVPMHLEIPTGSIVGVAKLYMVRRWDPADHDPWASGPFCWYLADPTPIPPARWAGRMGLFEVDPAGLPLATRQALETWLRENNYVGTRWWAEVVGAKCTTHLNLK